MKAIYDGHSVVETDIPELKPGEKLVEVAYAGVNRADVLQAAGHYPPPPGESDVLGLEVSGYVVDSGQPVAALLAGGGYAEYVAVPEGQLAPIPDGMSMAEAGGLMEVACTVWHNVFMLAGLKKGERILIHGGAGGIGTTAIQLAHHFGAEVAVTAGSPEKLELCKKLGADILINYKEQDFTQELKNSCNVILDIIGAKYLPQNVKALAPFGRMVTIGLQGGVKGELNLGLLLSKQGTIHATGLRGKPKEMKAEIVASTVTNVWPLIEQGVISIQLSDTLPLDQAAEAHRRLSEGDNTGKIVLAVD
ncbi:MAG: NAD(P)H-quinone oxidoreductase [Corynebacterium sp.]|nr:NAD(P)H-quinone oxidoreductase [Corynebacterium sp.]